ncbi:RNA-directed DNA polymerase, eukaryota, Reverse transcriptase zinc-binding domain protein [Artemisia annua]|uniref:RNA-directed DNA polymerase, eukaryota, Reverse transcriptase zinc-binding domain protein n=1 Tax=Artemisia annua TaxID=35608 RepID=A0A2U1NRG4_ARTAN|nr:RNA-directed DNA polymerase, eukaryota, Reverse transcriptase zinc-binding domain protein [Artemisia annua]
MKEAEDLEHLFFKCEFSEDVWDRVKERAKINYIHVSWDNTVRDLIEANNGNNIGSVVRRLCFAASVYSIWHERNFRAFRDVRREVTDVVSTVFETVKMKLMSLTVKNSNAVREVESDWAIVCRKSK